MAYVRKGHKPGVWKVFYYDRTQKKPVVIPAKIVRQWDGLPKEQVERKAEEWEQDNGIQRLRSKNRSLFTDDTLKIWIEEFIEYRTTYSTARASSHTTVKGHLHNYVAVFFVNKKGTKDVREWWKYIDEFVTWLRTQIKTVETVRKICANLRSFGQFLVTKRRLDQAWHVPPIKKPKGEVKHTPLPHKETPENVLKLSKKLQLQGHPKWALYILLGYFASLRPGEIFALNTLDFLVGIAAAKKDTVTYDNFVKYGYGSNLSVEINKTNDVTEGIINFVKTRYANRVVNIWSPEAAKQVSEIMQANKFSGFLYDYTKREKLDEEYKDIVRPLNSYLEYDWRRASGFFLGREKGLDIYLLQDHFAHAEMRTTQLYTRRPKIKDSKKEKEEPNWGAVS